MGKKERQERERNKQIQDLLKQAQKLRDAASANFNLSVTLRKESDTKRTLGNKQMNQADEHEAQARKLKREIKPETLQKALQHEDDEPKGYGGYDTRLY